MNYTKSTASFLNYCRASGMTSDTVANHERNLRYFSETVDLPEEITVAQVDEYKSLLHLRGLKQSTIRAYLESLSLFFAWATERKHCAENPCTASAVKTKVPPTAPYSNLLNREEMAALLSPVCPKGCTRKLFPRNHAIAVMLLTSGLRNSELRELTLDDLFPEKNQLIVRCGKGEKTRFAPYPPVAQEAVQDYLASSTRPLDCATSDVLFGKGATAAEWKPFARTELSTVMERFTKTVTGRDGGVRTHALRHANASFLWDSGMSMEDIRDLLGHSDTKTSQIYISRLRPETATQGAANAFSQLAHAV